MNNNKKKNQDVHLYLYVLVRSATKCMHNSGAAETNTAPDTQYLCQTSWTSWSDVMLLEIHYGLPPHLCLLVIVNWEDHSNYLHLIMPICPFYPHH